MLGFKEHQEVLEEKRKLKQDSDLKKKTETGKEKSVPAKTYKGLSKSTKEARHSHFEKNKDKADNDPSAYEPAPGDKNAKTRPSKYTKAFHARYGNKNESVETMTEEGYVEELLEHFDEEIITLEQETLSESKDSVTTALKNKSEKSGISMSILRAVFNRGVAAWKSSHRPGTSSVQWGLARCNSFISGGTTRTTADKDLWARHSASKSKGKPKTKPSTSSKPKKKSSRTSSKPRTSGGKAKLHP